MDVNQMLEEREKTHGCFRDQSRISQGLKQIVVNSANDLDADMLEALEMICHKMARILNGNPMAHDHWIDIAGYATLVANRLEKDYANK